MWPAPFVWMTDFLAPEEGDRLLALGVERREGFVAMNHEGGGSSSIVNSETRVGLEADRRTVKEARPRLVPKILSVLPDVLARLGMAGIDRCRIELAMRVYPTGGFFKAHRDYGSGVSRKLNFVYFFHRRPRRFSGGICCSTTRTSMRALTVWDPDVPETVVERRFASLLRRMLSCLCDADTLRGHVERLRGDYDGLREGAPERTHRRGGGRA